MGIYRNKIGVNDYKFFLGEVLVIEINKKLFVSIYPNDFDSEEKYILTYQDLARVEGIYRVFLKDGEFKPEARWFRLDNRDRLIEGIELKKFSFFHYLISFLTLGTYAIYYFQKTKLESYDFEFKQYLRSNQSSTKVNEDLLDKVLKAIQNREKEKIYFKGEFDDPIREGNRFEDSCGEVIEELLGNNESIRLAKEKGNVDHFIEFNHLNGQKFKVVLECKSFDSDVLKKPLVIEDNPMNEYDRKKFEMGINAAIKQLEKYSKEHKSQLSVLVTPIPLDSQKSYHLLREKSILSVDVGMLPHFLQCLRALLYWYRPYEDFDSEKSKYTNKDYSDLVSRLWQKFSNVKESSEKSIKARESLERSCQKCIKTDEVFWKSVSDFESEILNQSVTVESWGKDIKVLKEEEES